MFNRLLVFFVLFLLPLTFGFSETTHEKLVILGGGPAGLTTAIFAGQADLQPLVIEGGECDGQLNSANLIENYPGFPEGIEAEELDERLHMQAEKFGSRFLQQRVVRVELKKRPFTLTLENGDRVTCDALVVALGSKVKLLGLPSEQALIGKGISINASCDAPQFKGKEVFVVGSADSALEQALFLADFASKVTVLSRSDQLSGSKYLQEKVFEHPKIELLFNATVEKITDVEKGEVTGIYIRNITSNSVHFYPCQGVLISIGRVPNTDLFVKQLKTTPKGYVITKKRSMMTNVKGVFAAGDIVDPTYRKMITAASTGCKAGLDAVRYLEENSLN